MRVLVCGGRNYDDPLRVSMELADIWDRHGRFVVIQGGANGADRLAREWCQRHRMSFVTVDADWEKHGKAAGPIRNQVMIDEYRPDLVVAFPGGRGTADMMARARKAGLTVIEIPC